MAKKPKPVRDREGDVLSLVQLAPAPAPSQDPVEIIFRVAEKYSINCRDIMRFPAMVAETGLGAEVCAAHCLGAELLRAEKTLALQAKLKVRNARIVSETRADGSPVEEEEEGPRKLGEARIKAPEKAPKPKKEKPAPKPARPTYDGFAATNVIRRLGKEGWTIPEAVFVLEQLNIPAAFGTVRAQILAGQKGERGEPAALTPESLAKLNKLRKKFKK